MVSAIFIFCASNYTARVGLMRIIVRGIQGAPQVKRISGLQCVRIATLLHRTTKEEEKLQQTRTNKKIFDRLSEQFSPSLAHSTAKYVSFLGADLYKNENFWAIKLPL